MTFTEEDLRDALQSLEKLAPEVSPDGVHDKPPPSRRWVLPVAAAAAVCVLAAGALVLASRSGSDRPGQAGHRPPSSSAQPTGLTGGAAPKGYTKAIATNGATGFVKSAQLHDIQLTPANPTQALQFQTHRGAWGYVIPVYRADLHTVVGVFRVGHGPSAITCFRHDGIAFTVSPPASAPGADSPVAAAREVQDFYGISGFGTSKSRWTIITADDLDATAETDNTALQVEHRADGTWLVLAGEHCYQ